MDDVTLSACAGVTINVNTFGLADSTFVRNAGNFTHAFLGEGGVGTEQYKRVMSYSTHNALHAGAGTFATCVTSPPGDTVSATETFDSGDNDIDHGMSPAVDVSDFISNTGIQVSSIATNFNGQTNAVRADSLYILDEGLRLHGIAPAATGAYGMDMPSSNHAFAAGIKAGPPARAAGRGARRT